jgi:hypothetical protein
MIKHEAKFSIRFRHWLKANPIKFSCTFEMKDTCGKQSLNFKEVKQEQLDYGEAIKSTHPTMIRNVGGQGEPDYTYHYNCPAFVVINYPKGFVLIDVTTFAMERDRSKRKSLTWLQARAISTIEVMY